MGWFCRNNNIIQYNLKQNSEENLFEGILAHSCLCTGQDDHHSTIDINHKPPYCDHIEKRLKATTLAGDVFGDPQFVDDTPTGFTTAPAEPQR